MGASCAGKSSYVINKWIKNYDGKMKKDILPYYETKNAILIGIFDTEKGRRIGTDRINRHDIPLFLPQILKFYKENPNKDIILEGDRIVSRPLWNALIENNIQCKVYLIYCTKETSILRNENNNSTNSLKSLKACWTRAYNIYNDYKDIFDGEIISSENIQDFSTFGI